MSSVLSDTEKTLLEAVASDFGSGAVNLGIDPSLTNMDSFTMSVTFEMDTLTGGDQALIWNHRQFRILLKDDDLQIVLRGDDGKLNYITVQDAFDEIGYHDVQIVLDDAAGTLDIWIDGAVVKSVPSDGYQLDPATFRDTTAGGTSFGKILDGQIVDISIHDEVIEIDGSQSLYERMYALDEGDTISGIEQPMQGTEEPPVVEEPPAEEVPPISGLTEEELLDQASADFGEGVVNLGKHPDLTNMDSFTMSATFEMNTLSGGDQALIWNHKQFRVLLKNDDLQVVLRGDDGKLNYVTVQDAFDEIGYHDVQVILDDAAGTLDIWIDGSVVKSVSSDGFQLDPATFRDTTAGGTSFGKMLDGQIADISIHDEVIEVDGSQSLYERMYTLDEGDTASEIERPMQGTEEPPVVEEPPTEEIPPISELTEEELLDQAAADFGEGVVNLGNYSDLPNMDSFTMSATFEMNTLTGGDQFLLWNNHFRVLVKNDDLQIVLRGEDGAFKYITQQDVFEDLGWHDFQVILDDTAGTLNIWVDGENVRSISSDPYHLDPSTFSDTTAGGNLWEDKDLDGQIADVVISDEVLEVDGSQSVYERMMSVSDETPSDSPAENTAAEISGSETGAVDEDSGLTASGKLTATDVDEGESGFQGGSQSSAYGTFAIDVNGNWVFTPADNDAVQSLGDGDIVTETFTVLSIDGTPQEVSITLTGTNDVPTISGTDSGSVVEDGTLTVGGKLTVADKDSGESGFQTTTEVSGYGTFTLDSVGNWTFSATASEALQSLGEGDTVTETFTVLSIDGTPQEVSVTLTGTNDVPTISGTDSGSVVEDGNLTTNGTLYVDDSDTGESQFQAESQSGDHGDFSIDNNGNWSYTAVDSAAIQALNAGESITEVFSVKTADGTVTQVEVTIDGIDEPVVEVPPTSELTEEELLDQAATGFGEGVVNLGNHSDCPNMDSFTMSATFEMNTLTGGDQFLLWNKHFRVLVKNDDLQIVLRGEDGGLKYITQQNVFEDLGWHDFQVILDDTAGTLNIWVDGENVRSISSDPYYLDSSTFSDTTAGGNLWEDKDLDGQIADVVISDEVLEVDGSQSVYERMMSVSDETPSDIPSDTPVDNTAAVISGSETGAVDEDSGLTANGKLTAADVDEGESGFQAGSQVSAYGSFTIDTNGNWVFTPADNDAVQSLGDGDTVTESFTVLSIDGTPQEVSITLTGTNDVPTISGTDSGSVVEDGNLTTNGTLYADDPDTGESLFQAESQSGDHGDFSIDSDGNWSYTAVDSAAIQALNAGETITEVFSVKTADGTVTQVEVTIDGADETSTETGNVISVGSVAELLSALDSASDGDTIQLLAGDYEPFTISGINFADGVTITSADPNNMAHLESMTIKESSGLTIEGLAIHSEDTASAWYGENLININYCSNIEVQNNVFGNDRAESKEEGFTGIAVTFSSEIAVTNNEFFNVKGGASFKDSQYLDVSDNYVHDIRSDGFYFQAVQHVEIDGNIIKEAYPADGDHADAIQIFANGNINANTDIVIRNNIITQSEGEDSQGIFLKTDPGVEFVNVIIENNIVYQSGYHGISVYNAIGLEIRQNTIISPPDTEHNVWIKVFDSTNAIVENNISNSVDVIGDASTVTLLNNIIADVEASPGVLSYAEVFDVVLDRYSEELADFGVTAEFRVGAELGVFLAAEDPLAGDTSDNVIDGTTSSDQMFGFSGDDLLVGSGGDDSMFGGADEDTISGGEGQDYIVGGHGADVISGGAGSDIFAFDHESESGVGSENRDVISDFDAIGSDKISLEGLVDGSFNFIGSDEFSVPESTDPEDVQLLHWANEFDAEYGTGIADFGRGDEFFGMNDLTISVTFELNSLTGGKQSLLYNQGQYSLKIQDDGLLISMRNIDGSTDNIVIDNALSSEGWHDSQIVMDSAAQTLDVYLDGNVVYSGSSANYEIGTSGTYNIKAGGLGWGEVLDGNIADVTVLDQVVDFSAEETKLDRMFAIDAFDEFIDLDQTTGDAQARFDDETKILSVDVDGDLSADMEIELIGVSLSDLSNSDFLV